MLKGNKKIYTVNNQEELAHDNMIVFNDFVFNGTNVRVIKQNNVPWLCGLDVGKVLGYTHILDMYRMLPEDEKLSISASNLTVHNVHSQDSYGGLRHITFISLSGLFRIISALNRIEDIQFQNWVCSVVVPSIYANSTYMSPNTINRIDNDSNCINELETEYNDLHNINIKLLKEQEELKNINKTLSDDNIRLHNLINMNNDYTKLGKHIVDVVLKKM